MSSSPATTVVPVHGGLAEPVDRRVPAAHAAEWRKLPRVEVQDVDRTTLERIADGTLSPLEGPMGEADYRSTLERGALERGGRSWAWGIPVVLPLTDAEAARAARAAEIALVHEGELFARLARPEVYDWDKRDFVAKVYRTERIDHPGARLWTTDPRTKLVGGELELVPRQDRRPFARRVLEPRATRRLLEEKGYEQSVAFQTRNPLHRAHEYALVYGAEALLRESARKTGVVLNPLVGQLKGDDVPADVRMRTYEALVDQRFLGQGDLDLELWKRARQDFNDQLHLVGLDMRMYYGGPREAVMHSIYRQNLGFSHFIVGRKHADAPYDDGQPIWGDFDAQQIFRELRGELAIRTVNVGFAAYFEELGRVGLTEHHPGKTPVSISGTKMREILGRGELPDERVMRPSTARILGEHYKSRAGA
jgi:sulfate adenylyltransferase